MGHRIYKLVGYRGKSGILGVYKMVGKGHDKFIHGKERAHLKSLDGKLDFWVDLARIEAPPQLEETKDKKIKQGRAKRSGGQ